MRTEPKNAIIRQYEHLFSLEGAGLKFSNEALAGCGPVLVLVLFSSLESALAALQAGLLMQRLNLGHLPSGSGRSEVHPAVHLGPGDYAVIRKIEAMPCSLR